MKPFLTYLCTPYSDPDPLVREARYAAVTQAAAHLMAVSSKINVFSPITNSHPLTTIGGMQGDWKTWKRIDTQYLKASRRVIVLTLPGWRESVGVTAELRIARRLRIPIKFLNPITYILSNKPIE